MERYVEKINQSFDRILFRMAGPGERDEWMRAFPWPIPSGYRMAHRWEERKDGDWLICDPTLGLPSAAEQQAAGADQTQPTDNSEYRTLSAKLDKLSEVDLLTKAGENGVATKDERGKKLTKAALVAALAMKLTGK
jgi:hypothetical protein